MNKTMKKDYKFFEYLKISQLNFANFGSFKVARSPFEKYGLICFDERLLRMMENAFHFV